MQRLTFQEVTNRCYPIGGFYSPSTSIEEEMSEVLEYNLTKIFLKKKSYPSLVPLLRIDWSTVCPNFEIKSETSVSEMLKDTFYEEIEHDVIVCLSPRKRYTLEINIKAIRKGEPKIIEPEEIL
ncbi:MAG: hypothetical protein LWW94_08820 [Candidatus Desulfofervidaceae bacterium]|nr:hypothetical protein [Candidatus Desulfofervidaceae bacterium]